MQKIVVCILLMLWMNSASSQTSHLSAGNLPRFTLNGYVKDSLSGESIIGATISVHLPDGQSKAVLSNQYGFYSLTLDEGKYNINVSHVSYYGKSIEIILSNNQSYNFDIISKYAAMNEVIVYSRRR